MADISHTIVAKSDQLNADDLIGGPITILIERVVGFEDKQQPIGLHYRGDNGKPYKPGLSMRRVIIHFWGKESDNYLGQSMTLYRDPEVTFGKIKVGGIRISHMTNMDGGEMALTVTKGSKKLFTVRPLKVEQQQQQTKRTPAGDADAYIKAINGLDSAGDIAEYQLDERRAKWLSGLRDQHPAEAERIDAAVKARVAVLAGDAGGGDEAADTAVEPETGRSDEQHGDQHPGDDDDNDDAFPGDD